MFRMTSSSSLNAFRPIVPGGERLGKIEDAVLYHFGVEAAVGRAVDVFEEELPADGRDDGDLGFSLDGVGQHRRLLGADLYYRYRQYSES